MFHSFKSAVSGGDRGGIFRFLTTGTTRSTALRAGYGHEEHEEKVFFGKYEEKKDLLTYLRLWVRLVDE